MTSRWLPGLAVGIAVLAAWGAARYAGCLPLLFAAVLVTAMALPRGERRLIAPGWAAIGLAALAMSWCTTLDHELALRHSLLLVLVVMVFGVARIAAVDDRHLDLLAIGIAATAAVAVAQALVGPVTAPENLAAVAPELRTRVLERLAIGRVSGTASVPGHYAALLVTVMPLLAAGWRGSASWRRWLCGTGLLLAVAGVVLSRSLAAVGLAGALAAVAVAMRRPSRRLLATVFILLVAVGTVTALLRDDVTSLEPVRLRWINWQTAGWAFAREPLLGVGLGGVGQAGLTAPTGAGNITPYAHNTYLQLAAELGIAGIALGVAAGAGLWRLLNGGRREHLPLTLAVAAIPLHNVVDFSAYAPEVVLPWAVLAGTLAARVRPSLPRPLPSWLLLPALGGGFLLAAASWRAEALLTRAYAAPPPRSIELALESAHWSPWAIGPVLTAAGAALEVSDPRLLEIDRELARRWWVRPVSAAWAEIRARSLHAVRRDGEALVWAREARRRAPWRGDLADLEVMCRGAS